MADDSFVSESAAFLAELQSRLHKDDEARQKAARRGAAAMAVALLHVLFLVVLLRSIWVPAPVKLHEQRPLTWVLLTQPAKAPRVVPINPKKKTENGAVSTFVQPRFIRPPEENNAIDLGLALGRSLACGANSFEYLTSRQREACLHQPWHFVYDRYGNIVLDAQPRVVEEEKPRPSDLQARQRNTADPCAIAKMSHTECIDRVIYGDHLP